MNKSIYSDTTKYKAMCCGHYHDNGDIKTRKRWNDIYMIDVEEHTGFRECSDE